MCPARNEKDVLLFYLVMALMSNVYVLKISQSQIVFSTKSQHKPLRPHSLNTSHRIYINKLSPHVYWEMLLVRLLV